MIPDIHILYYIYEIKNIKNEYTSKDNKRADIVYSSDFISAFNQPAGSGKNV
jgi:hypothetical protein